MDNTCPVCDHQVNQSGLIVACPCGNYAVRKDGKGWRQERIGDGLWEWDTRTTPPELVRIAREERAKIDYLRMTLRKAA